MSSPDRSRGSSPGPGDGHPDAERLEESVTQWDSASQASRSSRRSSGTSRSSSDEQDQQIQPVQSSGPLGDGASRAEGEDCSSMGTAGVRAAPSGVTSAEGAGRSNPR